MVLLLIGDLFYEINVSVGTVLLGSLLAIVVAKVIEFFRFCVDYSRTEKVQFEDDEYYYYVKAVPKMTVSVPTKTVKKINSQWDRGGSAGSRNGAARQPARGMAGERGPSSRNGSGARPQNRGSGQRRGGSMTVGNTGNRKRADAHGGNGPDDYEEWT